MTAANTPDQMTWRFDGYDLVLDEDGLHLRINRNQRSNFEQPEVLELIERYQSVRRALATGFKAPEPPTREQLQAMGSHWVERRAIEDSIRTLRAQLEANTTDAPF